MRNYRRFAVERSRQAIRIAMAIAVPITIISSMLKFLLYWPVIGYMEAGCCVEGRMVVTRLAGDELSANSLCPLTWGARDDSTGTELII